MKTPGTINAFRPNRLTDVFKSAIKALIFLVFFGCASFSYSQKNISINSPHELTPVRGYYKLLESLSPDPKTSGNELDKIIFPFDQAFADKVLGQKPVYLQNITLGDFKIPAPPANSSAQTRAELDYLLALQHTRTPEDIRSSLYMSNVFDTPGDIGRSLGLWTGEQKLPLTDSLMDKVERDGDYFLWSLKFKYNRARPYMLDPKIRDLEESRASSFPSGHVTYAYIRAYIYEEIVPEFTDFFEAQAIAMSHARQIIGVHYPSDCEGSRVFARQFVNMLLQNQRFNHDLEKVKKEWAAKADESFGKLSKKVVYSKN
ncbi:MAG TPA: phosphatase PAP2 family protein [Mucilaginibacter sp.]|jgi:acid phosphatase (class A)